MNVAVIGTGYVGLTTAVSLAIQGHTVTGIDIDRNKIRQLQNGQVPIYEPGLDVELRKASSAGRIGFTSEVAEGVEQAEIIFICVGTPAEADGSANLRHVYAAAEELKQSVAASAGKRVIAIKSTVPVGTADEIAQVFSDREDFHVVSNPEFLREGTALHDALEPSRIVIGAEHQESFRLMETLYASVSAPRLHTTRTNAEMIKYASNAFLATRISFMNELARLCAKMGIDIQVVARGMGLDTRIGPEFLRAGLGYGGSCFPKDTSALLQVARENGVTLSILENVKQVNSTQPEWFLAQVRNKLHSLYNKRIALLGLAFKPDTDDVREAPSLNLISLLLAQGALVSAYDPMADAHVQNLHPDIHYAASPYEALTDADAALLVTEWQACTRLDWQRVKQLMAAPNLFDGRNAWPVQQLVELGFHYTGVGRS
jgi:UDPglucose 6-dehydrogenase